MDSLEIQLRRCTRSWRSVAGAAVTSAILFFSIGSTSMVMHEGPPPAEPPLTYAMPPPPPPTPERAKTTPPLSSSLAEAFKFDPTTAAPPPDIPLDLLDIRLHVDVDPGLAVAIDMQRTFDVQKPENPNRYVIYEQDQVDEIPVWLYGPNPRIPNRLNRTDCSAQVFYVVTDKGRTENIYILDADDPEFGAAVKEAIKSWRFRPARKAGKSVRVYVQQPVNFAPEHKSPFSI